MGKPTPGPWELAGNHAVVWHKDMVVAECPVDGGPSDDVRRANAHLIALAPEMVEFVERVAELDYHVKENNNRPKEILRRIEADARAILTKLGKP